MHVTLVPYLPGWSYDLTAQALKRYLPFETRIVHQHDLQSIKKQRTDLIVDFWWRGMLHKHFGKRVLKQVSSHRWTQAKYASMNAKQLIDQHLRKTGGVLVPSKRLRHELAGAPFLSVCPKGFHPETFGDFDMRGGGLSVGWAGASEAKDKNVSILRESFPDIRLADRCLTYQEMPDFYNSLDVITCASDAEGDPRPLIEGMACGCFPVMPDVGIVPELVRHGENGLIVERTPQAFAAAFQWCADNLEFVRAAGQRNAQEMINTRTWKQVSKAWEKAIVAAVRRAPPWPARQARIARSLGRRPE